jgi:hypothetical protein
MRRRTAGMDDTLRNPFMVEMHDLFAKDKILQQNRTARADFQRILVVGDGNALIGGQERAVPGRLMGFPAIADRGRGTFGFGGFCGCLGFGHVSLHL